MVVVGMGRGVGGGENKDNLSTSPHKVIPNIKASIKEGEWCKLEILFQSVPKWLSAQVYQLHRFDIYYFTFLNIDRLT